jgi:hypothetical protein
VENRAVLWIPGPPAILAFGSASGCEVLGSPCRTMRRVGEKSDLRIKERVISVVVPGKVENCPKYRKINNLVHCFVFQIAAVELRSFG